MNSKKPGVILVGHGGVPKDLPGEWITELKQFEAKRRKQGGAVSEQEKNIEKRIRTWPRTAESDPYRTGLESLASHLSSKLEGVPLVVAYNEFCAPTLEEAVSKLVQEGSLDIAIVTSMLTPGGSHSELEIPAKLDTLRSQYPNVKITYVWPFDLNKVADMLADHLAGYLNTSVSNPSHPN